MDESGTTVVVVSSYAIVSRCQRHTVSVCAWYVVVVRAEYISNVRGTCVPKFSLLTTYVDHGYYGIVSISKKVTFCITTKSFDLLKMGRVRVYSGGRGGYGHACMVHESSLAIEKASDQPSNCAVSQRILLTSCSSVAVFLPQLKKM